MRCQLEARIQELNDVIGGIDKELKEFYPKLKSAKGSSQSYFKQRVMMLMRKRKMYQQQVDNLLSQQFSIDQVAFTKEQIQNTIETTSALRDAVALQKQAMKEIDFDQLEDLRDEMDEMVMDSKEMNDLLNRDYTCEIDEDELDAELKELDDQNFFEELNKKESQKVAEKSQDPYAEIMNSNQIKN